MFNFVLFQFLGLKCGSLFSAYPWYRRLDRHKMVKFTTYLFQYIISANHFGANAYLGSYLGTSICEKQTSTLRLCATNANKLFTKRLPLALLMDVKQYNGLLERPTPYLGTFTFATSLLVWRDIFLHKKNQCFNETTNSWINYIKRKRFSVLFCFI